MPIRDILVHLDLTPRSAIRLELAAELATRYRAYLIGLYAAHGPVPASDGQTGAAMMEEAFRGVLGQQRLDGEWRLAEGSAAEAFIRAGPCADLTVLGQHDPQGHHAGLSEREFISVLRGIGRPVLAVPYTGAFTGIGERVLVVWDSGPESTRAVNESLPLLGRAKAVQILVSNSRRQPDFDVSRLGREILANLARHGIDARVEGFVMDKEIETGEALLSYAADFGADLMIAGAFIRSRVRELMFGSSVCTLITKMTVPLLLSS